MTAEARPAGHPAAGAGHDDSAHALRRRVATLEQALAEARRAGDAGRTSEDRFRALFDMSRDGIVFVDLDGHIEEMNQAYLDLVGYDRDEISTHTYQDLTPEKWRAGEAGIIETQVMRRGFSDEYEKEYVRKDGSIAPISLRTILVRDLEGRPVRFMGIVRDITELKEKEEALKASEKRYRSLFDLSHDGVVFVALDGPVEEANGALLDMLGYELDELTGMTYQQFTPPRWARWRPTSSRSRSSRAAIPTSTRRNTSARTGRSSPSPSAPSWCATRRARRSGSWRSCATSPRRSWRRRRWSVMPATSRVPTRSSSSSPTSPLTTCRSRCARSGPSAPCWRRRSATAWTTRDASTSTS